MSNEQSIEQEVPVSTGALIKRINRKLVKEGKVLKVTRGWRMKSFVGDYYVLDIYTNSIVTKMLSDPKELGQELGVLRE